MQVARRWLEFVLPTRQLLLAEAGSQVAVNGMYFSREMIAERLSGLLFSMQASPDYVQLQLLDTELEEDQDTFQQSTSDRVRQQCPHTLRTYHTTEPMPSRKSGSAQYPGI